MKLTKSDYRFVLKWSNKIIMVNKLGGKCKSCNENRIECLTFHHIQDDKEFAISRKLVHSLDVLEKEVEKCELLCCNCHSEMMYQGSRSALLFDKLLNKNKLCECSMCGYRGSNSSSLVFHHLDPKYKKFSVSWALRRSKQISLAQIEEELMKCQLLCSNCHTLTYVSRDRLERLWDKIQDRVNNYNGPRRKPVDVDRVYDLYVREGMSQTDIAKNLKCAKSTVSGIIKKLGVSKNRERIELRCDCGKLFHSKNKINNCCSRSCAMLSRYGTHNRPSYEALLEMRKTMTLQAIGNLYNVSRVAVHKWLRK